MGSNFTDLAATDTVTAATLNNVLDELDAAIGALGTLDGVTVSELQESDGGGVALDTDADGNLTANNDLAITGFVNLGPGTTLTISAGAITVTGSHHKIDTEGAAATDDLDTINGGSDGDLLVLRAYNSAHTVVVKHGTGNIYLDGSTDFSLDHYFDTITLHKRSGDWMMISKSNNYI